PHADRDVAVHAVAFPAEERVLHDSRADDQITTRPPERAGIAFAGDADLRAGIDPRGHRDADRLDHSPHAAAHTPRASALPHRAPCPTPRAAPEPPGGEPAG